MRNTLQLFTSFEPGYAWRKAVLFFASLGLYTLLFFILHPRNFAENATTLAVIPVISAAWMFGWSMGLLSGIFLALYNLVLLHLSGQAQNADQYLMKEAVEIVELVLLGILVGAGSDLRRGLQHEVQERKHIEQHLRENQALLASILEAMDDAVYSIAAKTREALVINRAAEELFGRPIEALRAQPKLWLEAIHPHDLAQVEAVFQNVAQESYGEQVYRILRPDGEVRWVRARMNLIRDEQGQELRIDVLLSDITERKQIEDAQQESEARYRSLFENNHTVMLLIDPDSRMIIDANPAAVSFYGYSRERLRTMEIGEINLLPSDPLRQALQKANKIPSHFFFKHRLANGEVRDVEAYTCPLVIEEKYLLYSIIHDVTERRQTEQQLHMAQASLRSAIVSNADGMLVTDPKGKILFLNPAAERMWGLKKEELVGQLFGTPPVTGEAAEIEIMRYQSDLPGGELISAEIRAVEMEWEGKQAVLVSLHDITKRKQSEQAEREQRALAEALQNTAAVLTSTLHLEEVLERILSNIGQVVPHQGANIILVDGDGTVTRIARGEGYRREIYEQEESIIGRSIANIPGLKWMAESGRPLIIENTDQYPGWVRFPETDHIRSYLGAPIRLKGVTVGFLNLDSTSSGFFNPTYAHRLQAFIDQAAVAIENAHLYNVLQQQAVTDELTQQYNRRGLMELGIREFDRSRRFNRPLSVVMIDIDHFKHVNDTFGHLIGDQVLRTIAERCRTFIREVDILGRYGGEEFLVILVENEISTAEQVAERLRQAVGDSPCSTSAGEIRATVSMGIATLTIGTPDLSVLIQQADQALYRAKANGRNCIVLYS